jgi:hypothetical protein
MPTLGKLSDGPVESILGMGEQIGLTPVITGRRVQITPSPQGPESSELNRILEEVIRHLVTLETLRPYFAQVRSPYSGWSGHLGEGGEDSLEYRSVPPTRTVTMNTRFVVRGRGKPKPYPLEDD